MTTIERCAGISTGLPLGVPWPGPLPGGGYRGLTQKLDSAVMRCAQWLRDRFKRDVVIRFNSDRQSGGAWIKDEVERDTGIGLGAFLVRSRDGKLTERIRFDTYLSARNCRAVNRSCPASAYFFETAATMDRAIAILERNLRPACPPTTRQAVRRSLAA